MTPELLAQYFQSIPDAEPVKYRLYHDELGRPLFYSMADEPGTYIEIDQQTYSRNATQVRVRNGVLQQVTEQTTQKLVPADQGTMCHCTNVAVIATQSQAHIKWNKKIYESN